MFCKIWNLVSLLLFVCSVSHAVEVDIGQLKGVYMHHSRDIETFLREAPAKCSMIFDCESCRTKPEKQALLNDLNVLFYGHEIDFSSNFKIQNSRISCYVNILEDTNTHGGNSQLLFLALTEADLAEEELWSLARFQIMCQVMSVWHEEGVIQYFNSRGRRGVLSRGLNLQPPSSVESELVKHLFESEKADDVLGEMMRRVEGLK